MLAEKRLQIRRQQFTEAGCRAADVGLHKYNSTKRIHRFYPAACPWPIDQFGHASAFIYGTISSATGIFVGALAFRR
jgi:hypothetical protein